MRPEPEAATAPAKGPGAALIALVIGSLAGAGFIAVMLGAMRSASKGRYDYPIFPRLLLFDDYRGAVAMFSATLMVAALPPVRQIGARLADAVTARPRATVGVALVLLCVAARVVYLGHSLSMDEYAPRLQAHAFAQGQFSADFPPALTDRIVPKASRIFLFANSVTGQVNSAYWPGLALLMTPFALVNAEWMLNPLLSALGLWLIFQLATTLAGDKRAGGWAMLFALASPGFVANAISFYAMPGLLTLNLAFAWLIMRGTLASAGLAGLVGGLALVMHNPVPHAVFAAPWLLWLLFDRARWPSLAAVLLGYLPVGAGVGVGWLLAVDAANVKPVVEAHVSQGFVVDWVTRFRGVFSFPTGAMLLTRMGATFKAWVWSMPGSFVLAGLAMRRRGDKPWTALFAASLLVTYLFYFFVVMDQGHGWGYRYLHTSWSAVPVLAGAFVYRRTRGVESALWRSWGGGLAVAGLLITPFYLWQVRTNITDSLAMRIDAPDEGRWVVFVAPDTMHYTVDLVQDYPGQDRVLTLLSEGDAADNLLITEQVPGAVLSARDARGSLWRLPDR